MAAPVTVTIRVRWAFGPLGYAMVWLYGRFLVGMAAAGVIDHARAMALYESAITAMIRVQFVKS